MALQAITEIDLDTNQPSIVVVHAKQYDTARYVTANLFNSGLRWYVPDNIYALVSFKKSDRTGGFYDATEDGRSAVSILQNRSVVTIILDRNMLTSYGDVSTDIVFYDSITSERLSTFSFTVSVAQATITELDLSSNSYFNVLAGQITEVMNAAQNMTGITASTRTLESGDAHVSVTKSSASSPYVFNFEIPRGPKGDTGAIATPGTPSYEYAVSTLSGSPPSSGWGSSVSPESGKYYWTHTTIPWSNNNTTDIYNVSYIGVNGRGAVATVNSVNPDGNNNVEITASDIMANDDKTVQSCLNKRYIKVRYVVDPVNINASSSMGVNLSYVEDLADGYDDPFQYTEQAILGVVGQVIVRSGTATDYSSYCFASFCYANETGVHMLIRNTASAIARLRIGVDVLFEVSGELI